MVLFRNLFSSTNSIVKFGTKTSFHSQQAGLRFDNGTLRQVLSPAFVVKFIRIHQTRSNFSRTTRLESQESVKSWDMNLIQNKRRRIKTGILYLCWDEPQNLAEASKFYEENISRFYKIPKAFSRSLSNFYLKLSGDAVLNRKFFNPIKDKKTPSIYSSSSAQAARLKTTLEHLMPEAGPVKCYLGFLATEKKNCSIESALIEIQEDSPEQVIIFPQYPHFWCYQTGSCIDYFCQALRQMSVPAFVEPEQVSEDFVVREIHRPNPAVLRQLCGNPKAYEVTPPIRWSLIDRWPTHPALTDAWAKIIEENVNTKFPDDVKDDVALLFVAPNRRFYGADQYKIEVAGSCLRIVDELRNRYPYRLAYYTSWNQWPGVDSFGFSRIRSCVRDLVKQGRRNILLVPLTTTVPNIDTEAVINRHITSWTLKLIGAHSVRLLGPPLTHPTFIHGMAEIVKNHMVNGSPTVDSIQYDLRCPKCIYAKCLESREMFSSHVRVISD